MKILIVFVYLVDIVTVNSQEPCSTPQNALGECIPINKCSSLITFLRVNPKTHENINYIRQFHCGFEGRIAKVCCPIDHTADVAEPFLENKNNTYGPTALLLTGISSAELLPGRDVCGQYGSDRIVGGEIANLDEFPWMALLQYKSQDTSAFLCGGALINRRYVLTAAHCLTKDQALNGFKLVSIRLGEYDLKKERDCTDDTPGFEYCSEKPIDVKIEEQIPHEMFSRRNQSHPHDIALLRLNKEVPYSDFITPICLPTEESSNRNGQMLTVVGWGTTETKAQSDIKLKTQVPLVQNTECSKLYENRAKIKISDSQLCAGGKRGQDSCRGDSGGPLMSVERTMRTENYVAIGVVSFGVACGLEGFPGVYTRVSSYMPWILNHIRG